MDLKAPIAEIFASYQGEGIFLGQPQVFIRFCGCNLRCTYCDTPETQQLSDQQKYISLDTILRRIRELTVKRLASGQESTPSVVSLTGGEPLLYPGFLSKLLPQLKKMKLKTYLETNGTLPEAFHKVARCVDVVAMDIKVPSSSKDSFWKEHLQFLKLARAKAFAKFVVTDTTPQAEITRAVKAVASVSRNIPFIFQPVTSADKIASVEPWKLYQWTTDARKKLASVHIVPQMHRLWKVK